MPAKQISTTSRKALTINLDVARYGTFAEIGAGQEVARHFFQAGKASQTIAKTISAYDMVFSDQIYGRENNGRYVCESRLMKMLDHEYNLILERLAPLRGDQTCFFAFADTVATSSSQSSKQCNGWLGVRFQARPKGDPNDIVLHVHMRDPYRLQQQEALGILGVNLLHAAFYPPESPSEFISMLVDNLRKERIEIDMIRFSGPDLARFDNRLMSLELVTQEITNAVMFGPNEEVLQVSDALFHRDVFIQRGSFRPVTKVNVEILQKGLQEFKRIRSIKRDPVVLMEMTLHNLTMGGDLDQRDFLDRIDTITALGHGVMVSNFTLFYQLKSHIRKYTAGEIGLVIGAVHLEKLFEESFYSKLEGRILEAFGKLFDDKTTMLVYPYKPQNVCLTAQSYNPPAKLSGLYQFLMSQHKFVDIQDCDETEISLHSEDVRALLKAGDPKWESLVPEPVLQSIKSRKLFGYKT